MAGMYGADIGQLRELARRLDSCASDLEQLRGQLGSQVQSSPWKGPDAARFRQTWQSDHSRQLSVASSGLRAGAESLRSNALEQERASSVNDGHATPTAGRAGGSARSDPLDPGLGILHLSPMPDVPGLRKMDLGWFLGLLPHTEKVLTPLALREIWGDSSTGFWSKAVGSGAALADTVGGAIRSNGAALMLGGAVKKAGLPGYLTGVAISQVSDVVDAVREIDLSATSTTWNYMTENPWESVVAGSEAVVDYLPKLATNFWPF